MTGTALISCSAMSPMTSLKGVRGPTAITLLVITSATVASRTVAGSLAEVVEAHRRLRYRRAGSSKSQT
jgi:hypothetical protein